MQSMLRSISIIVPAYNEAVRLKDNLPRIIKFIQLHNLDAELIVVDDGSTDDTGTVAETAFRFAENVQTQLIKNDVNRGKGYSVRVGLLASSRPVAVFSDADLSTPIDEVFTLIEAIEGGFDLAFGSRAIDRSLIGIHQPWRREQGGRIFNMIVRIATGLPFKDTQCGFKGFRRRAASEIFGRQRIDGFSFDVEVLLLAQAMGFSMLEVPVHWTNSPTSRVRVLHDSVGMLCDLFRIRRLVKRTMHEFPFK